MSNMSTESPPRRRLLLPPVVLLSSILAAVALGRWLPIADLWGTSGRWAGGTIISLALASNIYCALKFRRRQTTIIPFHQSSALLTDGPYQFSRNPIYLSMVFLLTGLAIITGSASPWLIPPLFMAIIARLFIRHEEAMLTETFGQEYQNYCNQVRRWL